MSGRDLVQCQGATALGCRNWIDDRQRSLCAVCTRNAERLAQPTTGATQPACDAGWVLVGGRLKVGTSAEGEKGGGGTGDRGALAPVMCASRGVYGLPGSRQEGS